jgi:DNA polymerase (family X)
MCEATFTCTSDWTDGTVPIAGMAEAAQARGYEYIALTDHSRRVAMTHGLDPARLARQIHEIDRLNERFKNFTILKGIEVDILRDGSLDLPDSSLAKLDISAARTASCYLEINAEPDRLDLNDLHAHAAKLAGVKLAVSTDAHSIDAFQCMRFGIDQARRAWLTANDVLNTRPLAELRKLLKR